MAVYYINMLLILGLAWPLCLYKPCRWKKILYLCITLGYMWWLATFRYAIGFDYFSYIMIFEKTKAIDWSLTTLLAQQHEIGFVLLTKIMGVFISSWTVMYGVYAALVLVPIGYFIYRHCRDVWFSVWLFVMLTFFYTSMSFVRQSLACSVIVLGYDFLKNKKTIPFLLVVLLAGSFHKTALIMIPVYFLCHIKLNKWLGIAYGAATVIAYASSRAIWNLVTSYVFTSYHDSVWASAFSFMFLIIPVSVFAACLALWPAWRKRYPEADMLLNLMMYSMIIWLFITRHFILERLSLFIYIFVLVALPQAISCLKCSDEEYEKLAEIKAAPAKKGRSKAEVAEEKNLVQKIKDHQKYYWSAVAAVLLLTVCYHEYGAFNNGTNGFHAVFPYRSVIQWLDNPPESDTGSHAMIAEQEEELEQLLAELQQQKESQQ